jgi:diguanylate cyclase (GGDEF)-like protein
VLILEVVSRTLFRRIKLALAMAALLVFAGWAFPRLVKFEAFFPAKHGNIRDLQELPIGVVAHLQGVVTYADPAEKRFWIQDNTGAIAIDQDPRQYGLHARETVNVAGTKAHPYSALLGPTSVGLTNVTVSVAQTQLENPPPAVVSLRTLPAKDRIGIRVEVTGVVHQVMRDPLGRVEIALGDSGQEVWVGISETNVDMSQWVDARVRVVGVSESIYDDNDNILLRHIWVQNSDGVQLEEGVPKAIARLYSLRSLYRDSNNISTHRIRLRGVAAAHSTATSLLIEDQWGAIACDLDQPTSIAIGTAVEIAGFPAIDGRRIELLHSIAVPIPAQLAESEKEDLPVLRTVASVRELDEEQASAALPARVTGIITYSDPSWRQLFLQDSTGGIYVKYSGPSVPLEQGERVTVIGITDPGDYAPVIVAPKFVLQGQGSLPHAVPITPRDASSGIMDSQFVEVQGVIHPLRMAADSKHLTFELFSPLGQIHIYTNPTFSGREQLSSLVDASVRVRGVFGTVFNSRRQLVGYSLSVSSIKDIQVLERGSPDPFQEIAIPINSLLRFSRHADSSHRVKVKGSVTMLGRGFFYLQDDTGGLEVQSDTRNLRLSDEVEAGGYASPGGGYSPVLTDAMVRIVKHDAPVSATRVTAESSSQGQFDSRLVAMDGRLLSVVDSPTGESLIVQSGLLTLNAQLDTLDETQALPQLTAGSMLRLTGICSVQVSPSKLYLILAQQPIGFNLVLRSSEDVKLLEPAPWWSLEHAFVVLGILLTTVLAGFGWVATLRARVRNQTAALLEANEKGRRVRDLASAMQEVTLRKNFSGKVAVRGNDDTAQLGIEFNKMLSELTLHDAAKQKAEEKLQYQALTDELTGLPNRRLLSDRLGQTLNVAKREGCMVGVLYIDLDGFKLVNDSLGHSTGDLLLAQVGGRLQSRIRQSDTLARLGGDEFTVVLTKMNGREDAGRVGTSLLEVLAEPFVIDHHEFTISASIGISVFPENGDDGIALLQQADSAMYTAKRNGKNQMVYFTAELGSLVRERLSLENQLRGAIARGEIGVHYQPEFDVGSGRLLRFEALARWTHPTLGMIPPEKFIPIAEESGLIIPLGAHIMELACTEAATWQTISPDPVEVAVNVSSLQFTRETFVEDVTEVLRHTGLKPNLLQIELTESAMLSGVERAAETMKRLRALGVSLAIDDFGTGYSCLGYLPKLPFGALKIDRSFVKELGSRPETKAMVQSLVNLAHNLDMKVIVEGVETPEELAMIREFGSNEVQGYLLGRPTPDPASHLRSFPPTIVNIEAQHEEELVANGKIK